MLRLVEAVGAYALVDWDVPLALFARVEPDILGLGGRGLFAADSYMLLLITRTPSCEQARIESLLRVIHGRRHPSVTNS